MQNLVRAMSAWPGAPDVHHAALQCLTALCKDNAMMKAHVTVAALPAILAALRRPQAHPVVIERGYTLLGVLQVWRAVGSCRRESIRCG